MPGRSLEKRSLTRLGRAIKSIRLRHGLSQEKLSFLADLDRSYVGGVERGERNVSFINLLKLTNALGVTLADLFDKYEGSDG